MSYTKAVILMLLIALTYGGLSLFPPHPQTIGGPRMALGSASSLNWAGYAVAVKSGGVGAAYGSWSVPSVSCGKKTTYVAFWVGIDGYNDSTVEQTGVLVQCQRGVPVYSAWYEFYPASPVYAPASDAVKPGDVMVGVVKYSATAGCFTTTLIDKTSGWTYTSPCTAVSGALRSDAEWITERPAVGGSLTTLADFGAAYFGQDYTSVSHTNIVTIGGTNYTIAGSPNYDSITMVSSNGATLAAPSALTSDGTSFYVSYFTSSNPSRGR